MAGVRHQYGLPRAARLRRQPDFDRVYQANVYVADATLVVQGCRGKGTLSRLGLSVSRRVGNAVTRNRWKRILREAFRRQRPSLPGGLDLVVRPRRGAVPSFPAVWQSLPSLARRLDHRLRHVSR